MFRKEGELPSSTGSDGELSGQAGRADLIISFPHPGVQLMMLGMYTLLLLWGLATPCLGLLETVGTLARIDKDELGKGEPEACG